MAQIDNYGCWCYLGGPNIMTGRFDGKGEPVNEFDQFCKSLNQGYECAVADSAAEGISCEPWNVNYVTPPQNSQDVVEKCTAVNAGDICGLRACIVEQNFV